MPNKTGMCDRCARSQAFERIRTRDERGDYAAYGEAVAGDIRTLLHIISDERDRMEHIEHRLVECLEEYP